MTYPFDTFVADVQRTLNGYGLTQDRVGLLTTACGSGDLKLYVDDASGFDQGIAELESETIWIQSVDRANNILTLSADGRGYMGTTAASHGLSARCVMSPVFPKVAVANAINEAIDATYPTLYKIETTQFTWNPVVTTYQMPADAIGVLAVRAQTVGPSLEWRRLDRFEFRAYGGTYPQEIVIQQGGFPGRPIQVVYAAQPITPIATGTGATFESSGLLSTAKKAVRYHAESSLIAAMDVSRINVGSAQALAYDPNRNPIGIAAKLSAQLYQRYEMELEQERKRLNKLAPMTINMRLR